LQAPFCYRYEISSEGFPVSNVTMGACAVSTNIGTMPLDDGALPIRQFLGHARKLGIEDPQEKWERMGMCVRLRVNMPWPFSVRQDHHA